MIFLLRTHCQFEEILSGSEATRQPQSPVTVQWQVDVHPQPLTFSEDMSNEQLALWLSNHPKLRGTDYQQDISKLKGIDCVVPYCLIMLCCIHPS